MKRAFLPLIVFNYILKQRINLQILFNKTISVYDVIETGLKYLKKINIEMLLKIMTLFKENAGIFAWMYTLKCFDPQVY